MGDGDEGSDAQGGIQEEDPVGFSAAGKLQPRLQCGGWFRPLQGYVCLFLRLWSPPPQPAMRQQSSESLFKEDIEAFCGSWMVGATG